MEQDRELLERAAKAAGIEVNWHEQWQCFVRSAVFNTDNPPTLAGQRHVWTPLTDDGDALRLAVTLRLIIEVDTAWSYAWWDNKKQHTQESHINQAPIEATRRAIVRAAAEMGRSS